MNISLNTASGTRNLFVPGHAKMMKSTEEKLARQQEMNTQINFFEQQKENLKSMECGSIDEIARKLDLFHSYEDQIAAAKQSYNQQQMFHGLDEAKERGEQIAKEAKEYAPKDAEERRKELQKEAAGTDETGALSDTLESLSDAAEELTENMEELAQTAEEMTQEIGKTTENLTKTAEQADTKQMTAEASMPAEDTVLLAQRTFEEKRTRKSVDLYA